MADLEKPSSQAGGSIPQVPSLEARAKIIAETASDAIITIDEDSNILFINRAAEAIFGYSVSEMLGQHLTMLMPEYLRHLHRSGIKRYADTGKRHISWEAIELPGLHKSGKEISLEISFGEFSQEGKKFFTGVARDITRRKRDKQLLVLQNSLTQILAESTSLKEAALRLLEAICGNLGWQVGELWTLPPQGDELAFVASWHLPSADVSEFMKSSVTSMRLGVGVPGRICSSKAPIWLDYVPDDESFPRAKVAISSGLNAAFGFPILLANEIVGVIDFFSETIPAPEPDMVNMMMVISSQLGQFIQRKSAENEVRRILAQEQEARLNAEALTRQLSALQRVTDAALASLSLDDLLSELLQRVREVLHVDTAAILLLEREGNELFAWAALGLEEEVEKGIRIPVGRGFAGRIIAELKPIIIDDLTRADVYNPLLREKGVHSLLGVPLLLEGRGIGVIHVGTLHPSRFTEEDVRLMQLVADRIALSIENSRLYETERDARTTAEKANRLKDEFLTIMSHELRTPLTPIMGWSHMMRGGLLSKNDFGKAILVINKNSERLKHLIDDLLDMSAIMSGKFRIEQEPVVLENVLREAVESLGTYAQESRVQLTIEDIKEQVVVKGDRGRLVQTFSNILHNAIKFTPPGGSVKIATEVYEREAIVSVKDSGEGIPKEFLPHVFERFRQKDGSRTRAHGGLGIGLALVKSFVEAHGGTVSVDSEGKNRGTALSVKLPLEFSSATVSAPAPARTHPTEKVRVLIVEDQLDTLELLTATFAARGFETISCRSAAEALLAADKSGFDMIVSDIAMPEMDGLELIANLRRNPRLTYVTAVALTGYASEKDAAIALQAGFDVHIGKPVDPAELTTLVENLLRSKQRKAP